ncbi:hypothetical protein BDD12DRAFT_807578 [Trichophaea hybrida]|nr:hypothetical protein BDD12DRAFT_807578 [Trichophaea hybrida]
MCCPRQRKPQVVGWPPGTDSLVHDHRTIPSYLCINMQQINKNPIQGITCILSVGALTYAQIKNHVIEKWWKRIALDVLNFLMFIISLALLAKPVGRNKHWFGFIGDKAPSTAWHTAAALAAIEMLLMVWGMQIIICDFGVYHVEGFEPENVRDFGSGGKS